MGEVNSRVFNWTGPAGLPHFAGIDDGDLKAAFDAALALHSAEIDRIAGDPAPPDYNNTIVALETSGDELQRVSAIFWNRAGAHSNDTIQSLEREIAPKLARHYSSIAMNEGLFARIDRLWDTRAELELGAEAARVLERHWKGFVRAGAKLKPQDQSRLATINEELAGLGAKFSQNVLADEKSWFLGLSSDTDLEGIPDFLRDAMAAAARERGLSEPYAVTLSRSIIEPFLTFSERRDLREQAFTAWISRGDNGNETDNSETVSRILELRAQKARLLGYTNFAELKLDDTMAKTPEAVNSLLMKVWDRALLRARKEEDDIASLIAEEGHNHCVAAWDWRHYSEKLRARKFDFSEAELKPYLQLEKIIEACFSVANRLFGLTARERSDIEAYHPDVRVFEIFDESGRRIGLFLGDYFARASKRSGAWMSSFQSQHRLGDGQAPIIYNVMNFAKPPEGKPALLSLDDARTLFHEFGHALHGLLSDVDHPSVSGTSVSRDFVELPSQLYEHWLTVPEILQTYAVHHETGKAIPPELLEKVLAARNFNGGFAAIEYTASALVDMAFHTSGSIEDPLQFEEEKLAELGMPKAIVMRHRTPHFLHVFSGDGYSAGYYSYMWSEVLDADAFSAFEETGDVFHDETATRLHQHIYSAGGSIDPEETYVAFRGKMPDAGAMLKKKGLATTVGT
ncbi:M3 family metallopeptidase [Hoeflea prorocentri]|uniref:M3 family metallopeptidase n=1 Tax=Hoeflea prorocentri TaxID=1922333 RepID=A0A9X3UMH4_9HYPH|nr:M3 family metallopeptidase [Hoeflea prorocentri]MCY6383319.1 M3 family metallopeptidase [Hoeflea prorocentri]MDA5401119.1 M3 family metallopeptidase [Hoeflea prorocentri]